MRDWRELQNFEMFKIQFKLTEQKKKVKIIYLPAAICFIRLSALPALNQPIC